MYSVIYFPIHRAKRGEIAAIGHLSPVARTRVRPIFDILKPRSKSSESIESYLSGLAYEFAHNWGTKLPIGFDFLKYGPDEVTRLNQHPVEHFFACANQLRIQCVPIAGPESVRGPGYRYLDAVARIARNDKRGAIIRMPYREFSRPDTFPSVLGDVLRAISLRDEEVDLILDFEALALLPDEAHSVLGIVSIVYDALRAVADRKFRNIVLCGSSIPEQVGRRYDWSPMKVPRVEFQAWVELLRRVDSHVLRFGDYGVIYAHGADANIPRRPPSRIRLSAPTHHLLCRAPAGEYRKLCAAVIEGEDFRADFPAWGAATLYACGIGSGNSGGPSDWVARDTNLHYEVSVASVEAELVQLGRGDGLEFATPEATPWLQARLDE